MTENFGTSDPTETTAPSAGPAPGMNTQALKDVRAWRRAVGPDRKVAGVAAGMGRALNIDPTILRVLFVVLAFANGFGLLVYLVAWLLMPEEGQEEPILKSSSWVRTAIIITAAVFAALIGAAILGALWAAGTPGAWTPWPLVPIALVVIAVVWFSQHSQAGSTSAGGTTPTSATPLAESDALPQSGTPSDPGAPEPPASPVPPAPRVDRGPRLFGLTLALLAIGLGTLGIIDHSGTSVPDAAYPALGLAIIGAMLVVGSVAGRAGGLIFLGIVFSIALAATATVGSTWNGDHNIQARPATAAGLQPSYTMGAGEIHLDLSDITDLASLDGKTIDITLNVGEVLVEVPDDLGVNLIADVRYGGAIDVPNLNPTEGWGAELTHVVNPDATTRINLNVNIRFGHIEVRNS